MLVCLKDGSAHTNVVGSGLLHVPATRWSVSRTDLLTQMLLVLGCSMSQQHAGSVSRTDLLTQMLLVLGCSMFQQHAGLSQGRICSHKCCWFWVASCPSNMLVCLKDGSAHTNVVGSGLLHIPATCWSVSRTDLLTQTLLVLGCSMSQQHAGLSQGRICSHKRCWFWVAPCPSNMLVCLKDGSVHTTVSAATLTAKLLIRVAISPTNSLLTLPEKSWIDPHIFRSRGKCITSGPPRRSDRPKEEMELTPPPSSSPHPKKKR